MKHTFGHCLKSELSARNANRNLGGKSMRSRKRIARLRCVATLIALPALVIATHCAAADNPAEILELPTIEVVGITPLPGLGTRLRDVPANVQIITGKDLAKQRQSNFADYLE